MNRVTLIGRLTRDVEIRYTSNQKAVASFGLATNDGKDTEFHNIVAWEKTAELAAKYLNKGKQVAIEGKIKTESYQNKEQVKVYKTVIVADRLEFLGQKEADQIADTKTDLDEVPF